MSHSTAEAISPSRKASRSSPLLAEFEVIYRTNCAAVTAFFARRSADPQTVADLTADTFVEAMSSFGSYDPRKGAARPWLFAIARRVYAKHCERTASRQATVRRARIQEAIDVDETEELVGRIDAERTGRELIERLVHMPAVEREAIELVDIAGLTPKEAAVALGLSPGTLRVRLFRARARLRKENPNV